MQEIDHDRRISAAAAALERWANKQMKPIVTLYACIYLRMYACIHVRRYPWSFVKFYSKDRLNTLNARLFCGFRSFLSGTAVSQITIDVTIQIFDYADIRVLDVSPKYRSLDDPLLFPGSRTADKSEAEVNRQESLSIPHRTFCSAR